MKTTTIMLVEDDSNLRMTLREVLAMLHPDWRILEATDGQQGIDLALVHQPDVILLDYTLPGMNGYAMALTLRQIPQTRHIPLILCTSDGMELPPVGYLRALCQGMLPKPFSMRQLTRTLEQALTVPVTTNLSLQTGGRVARLEFAV